MAKIYNNEKLQLVVKKEYQEKEKRIAELGKQIRDLNAQLSDVRNCFIGASSGDDFEMAESAREVMEVLNIHCYRHGEVKSNLTKAKEIIKDLLSCLYSVEYDRVSDLEEAEQFLEETK